MDKYKDFYSASQSIFGRNCISFEQEEETKEEIESRIHLWLKLHNHTIVKMEDRGYVYRPLLYLCIFSPSISSRIIRVWYK
jgi:hypothetical protein